MVYDFMSLIRESFEDASYKVNFQIRTGWFYWNGGGGGGGGSKMVETRGRGLKPNLCISTQRRMRFKPLP